MTTPGSVQDSRDTDIDEIALDVDRPPSSLTKDPDSDSDSEPHIHIHHPLSPSVLALLIPGSIFGLLARLGLQALATYDGRSIFPLAYVQAVGCLIMGIGLELKEPFGRL
jgi:fluoride exporter